MSILREYAPHMSRKGVIHSFTSGLELGQLAVELGFCLGINGIVTFNKAENVREVVKATPIDRLLLETDSPFLTPVPYRGTENAPKYLPFIAEKIAEQRAQVVDVASLSNLGSLLTYTSFQSKTQFQAGRTHLRQLLHKGAAVQGRVGSRWYSGKIHIVNEDGSIDVCFDDNDFRPCVPSDRIKVCLGDGSWVLAFDVLKHSTIEMQELRVLHRKSKKYLRRLGMNLQAGLQCLYAEHVVLKLLSTVKLHSINRPYTHNPIHCDINETTLKPPTNLNVWSDMILANHKLLLIFLRQASLRPVSLKNIVEQMQPSKVHLEKEILVAPLLSPACGIIHVTETTLDFLRSKILI